MQQSVDGHDVDGHHEHRSDGVKRIHEQVLDFVFSIDGLQDIEDIVLGWRLVGCPIFVVEALQGPHHGCDEPLQLVHKVVREHGAFVRLYGVHIVF